MANYQLLADLLPYLTAFEESGQGSSAPEFIAWLQGSPQAPKSIPEDAASRLSADASTSVRIAHLLDLVHKYRKSYIKKSLSDSPLQHTEDFAFLATLYKLGDLRKNELIQLNANEFTAGMEVIRRLERKGLIEAFLDPADRRARRVQLTEAGYKAFYLALPQIEQVSQLFSACFSIHEQAHFLALLQQAHQFHHTIFQTAKSASISELLRNYVDS